MTERLARDKAMARAESGEPEWVSFAKLAFHILACEREEFTTDDVWRMLHDHGIPDPREHRRMSAATSYGQKGGLAERTEATRSAELPATRNHAREQRVWRSLIVGREPPEWPAPRRRAHCPTCGTELSRLETTVSPRFVYGSCPAHGRLLVRLDP